MASLKRLVHNNEGCCQQRCALLHAAELTSQDSQEAIDNWADTVLPLHRTEEFNMESPTLSDILTEFSDNADELV